MKVQLKIKIITHLVVIIVLGMFTSVMAQQKFDKAAFYTVMSTGKLDDIESEIPIVQASSTENKEGYEGALLMKKAGMVGKPKQKLAFFKEGRIKLETAILADNNNTEFHFLRLAIEEHAPKIVKYRSDIEKDKMIIQKNFKSLSPVVQHAITDYCKNSKVLHAEDL